MIILNESKAKNKFLIPWMAVTTWRDARKADFLMIVKRFLAPLADSLHGQLRGIGSALVARLSGER